MGEKKKRKQIMFNLRSNLGTSFAAQIFRDNTGHNILELFNNVLTERADLEQLVKENGVHNASCGTPGLIIQSYLIMVKLFELDVMEPIQTIAKREPIEINDFDTEKSAKKRHYFGVESDETDEDSADDCG